MYPKKLIASSLLLLLAIGIANAQVTIGSKFTPRDGALLDLKQDEGATQNSTRGIGMPRVALDANNTINMGGNILPPAQYDEHIGLLVYNTSTREGSQIVTEEEKLCPGLHVWTGDRWVSLNAYDKGLLCVDDGSGIAGGSIEVVGNRLIYTVASGKDLRTREAINFDLQWTPTTAGVAVVESVISGFPKITFNPAVSNPTGTGTASVSLTADAMTDLEIAANLFASKAIGLNYSIVDDKGDTKTVTVEINQTNYALLVLNETGTNPLVNNKVTSNAAGEYKVKVQSNAPWTLTKTADAAGAIASLDPMTGGSKQSDGNAGISDLSIITKITADKTGKGEATLTFASSGERLMNDVTVTVEHCDNSIYYTGVPTIPTKSAIATSGTTVQVPDVAAAVAGTVYQSVDQDGNPFLATKFGNDVWMSQNLGVKTFAVDRTDGTTVSASPIIQGDAPATNDVIFRWRNPSADGSDTEKTYGLLYNFHTASMATAVVGGNSKVQGVCPTGWHLPTIEEGSSLVTFLTTMPITHSLQTSTQPLILSSSALGNASGNTISAADRELFVGSLLPACMEFSNSTIKPKRAGYTPNNGGFNMPLIGGFQSSAYVGEGQRALMHLNYFLVGVPYTSNRWQLIADPAIFYQILNPTNEINYESQASIRCVADRD